MIKSIKLLHNKECGFWQKTKVDLEELLKELGIDIEVEEILIEDDEQAKRYRFFGSPQVMINDEDIDPMAKTVTNFHASGCRLYVYKDKMNDFPPKEMLGGTLRKFSA